MSTKLYPKSQPSNIPPPSTGATRVPRSLYDLPFFGVWKREHDTKIPYNPLTGRRAKANDASTFATHAQAERAFASGKYEGLCVLVDASLGITVLDLDHVVPEEHAGDETKLPPNVRRVIRMANTYTTWSPSRTGIRMFFAATTERDYENKNHGREICIAEQYNALRFATVMTNAPISHTPDSFNDNRDDLVAVLDAFGFKLRAAEQPSRPQPTYNGGSRSNAAIIEAASRVNGEKFRRLHAGDITGYPESQTDKGFSSEADGAYVLILCGYTGDDAQVADIWRSESRLYRKKLDRPDYVDRTIESARRKQSWWFDWESNGRFASHPPNTHLGSTGHTGQSEGLPTAATGQNCDKQLSVALQTIARQAETIRQQRETLQGIERILANDQIQIGPRVTGIALLLELNSQKQRGKQPKEHGHHIPAIWLARRTGSTAKTANTHAKTLQKMGVIERKIVSEVVKKDEVVDQESGEIFTVGEVRKRAYYPADQASAIITNLAEYRRKDEDPKHGGDRQDAPYCEKHPDAGTVKRSVIECAECEAVLDRGKPIPTPPSERAAADSSRRPKMGHQYPTVGRDRPKMGQRDLSELDDDSPDHWTPPPIESEPWWWNEGVGS